MAVYKISDRSIVREKNKLKLKLLMMLKIFRHSNVILITEKSWQANIKDQDGKDFWKYAKERLTRLEKGYYLIKKARGNK